MKIQIISLIPEMFDGVLNTSMLWKAQYKKLVSFTHINLRDFGLGPRKQVDDNPYGGGDGMLLKPEPLVSAIEMARSNTILKIRNKKTKDSEKTLKHDSLFSIPKVVLMTPIGKKFTQAKARELAKHENLIFACARYEGYDERVVDYVDEQISIGDYVLTGGELPAMVVIDSVVRLIPGVLGGENSAEIESFSDGKTLEFPQYTRPVNFRDKKVPDVLLSGNHLKIEQWRKKKQEQNDRI